MAKIKEKLKLIKLRLCPSPRSTKIMLTIAILFAMMALLAVSMATTYLNTRTEELRQKAAFMEQENKDLQENIGILGSVQSIIQIAKDELGFVDPNTIILSPES